MPGTVTVACALPHGFRMQLQHEVTIPAPSREDPTRKEKISRFFGEPVIINGPAPNRDQKRVMDGNAVPTTGGYALTFGVSKDLWDKWKTQMEDWEPLVKGQVFAHENSQKTKDEARAGQFGPSGFEPFNPSNPPDEFKGRNGKSLIETATQQGG